MEANNMALREFAEYLANYPTCEGCEGKKDSRFCESCPKGVALAPIALQARIALAKPPRQCDVGTAEEQERRWSVNCGKGIPNCKHCKVYEKAKNSGLVNGRYLMRCDCRFIWAQMPYEAENGGIYVRNEQATT